MSSLFLSLSVALTLLSVVPYARDILNHKTKPNLASWIVWTVLTGIAAFVTFAAGETVAGITTLAAAVGTAIVVLLGWKYGHVAFAKFDWFCLTGALVGLLAWVVFDSAPFAILITVTIDFIGALPTIRHAWMKPNEETWATFLMGGLGGFFAILALPTFNATALPYPLYITLINIVLVAIILRGKLAVSSRGRSAFGRSS